MFTTNEEDRKEVANLQERLAESNKAASNAAEKEEEFDPVPSVSIDPGANKYVLIRAKEPTRAGKEQYFVISQRGAAYHRNAAEPMLQALQMAGYREIEVTGGGRISLDPHDKKIEIFGFSYGFGQGDHEKSKSVIQADSRYQDFKIEVSNSGY